MTDDLSAVEAWVSDMLAKVSPSERRKLALAIGRQIRDSQAERIGKQTNPDGTPFVPRKRKQKRPGARSRVGRIRRQAMFQKIRTARWLSVAATASGAEIGFSGRVARIAAVHQEGERAPVTPGGPEYQYPRRVLLGYSSANRDAIRDQLVAYLQLR
jgi:phage virion morphogenesis protein